MLRWEESFPIISIIEALNILEKKTNLNIKKKFLKQNRIGDHIWYISNTGIKNHYPSWKQKYSSDTIIEELISGFKI